MISETALMERQLAEIDLPPEVEAWFVQVAGCIKTRLPFDSLDFDRDALIYDDWEEEAEPE